ncbi:DUF305 domain-containing protein [Cellulomonas marina]|uniref:Uncharacterized conserved protein, DUF305 family n=1 Tax=Cellulomonas marina TaxID=988821 RepID=A0A1I1AW77_9CELL|nr:DUF305 domain-containing protein [Cellulomonas marina]GIG30737.1 DUF305 domain-containing protein [Cellulomonas marina]SFB41792.1 Uncharacterized conserved protein, DUF305 family [Cellulomonas marina]
MNSTTRRRLAAAMSAITLAATLAACSGTTEPADGSTTTSPSASGDVAEHNDADAQFAQMMIIHHEGAIQMSELAVEKASTPQVRELAERIAAAQGPEIELMSGWLDAWGEGRPDGMDMGGMDHGGMDMEGMDQDEAMGALDELEGVNFDRSFLDLMTAHHQGAIEMAERQLAKGAHPEAIDLARAIIDDQTAEIDEMQEILRGL